MVKSFDVDGLLAMPVMAFETEILTAKDMLDHCAYALGGIHVGKKKLSAADALLRQVDLFQQRMPTEFQSSPPLLVLLALARVALKGLEPLTEAVRTTG